MEVRAGREHPCRVRVRWVDATTKRRLSQSTSVATPEEAHAWIDAMVSAAQGGVDPVAATRRLAEYGESVMTLALRPCSWLRAAIRALAARARLGATVAKGSGVAGNALRRLTRRH